MITAQGKHYLYRHIRLDKNEVFYIGIGTKGINKKGYGRAFENHNENSIWVNIVNKSDYEVEILLESDDYNFIKQKEIEFIALYGRKNLGTGTLANLTDGGDGQLGRVVTLETKKKISDKLRGRKIAPETLEKRKKTRQFIVPYNKGIKYQTGKPVYQYDLEGNFIKEWASAYEAADKLNLQSTSISRCCNLQRNGHGGYMWFFEKKTLPLCSRHVKVMQRIFRDNNIIIGTSIKDSSQIFVKSIKEICKYTKSVSNVFKCLDGNRKSAAGYTWNLQSNLHP